MLTATWQHAVLEALDSNRDLFFRFTLQILLSQVLQICFILVLLLISAGFCVLISQLDGQADKSKAHLRCLRAIIDQSVLLQPLLISCQLQVVLGVFLWVEYELRALLVEILPHLSNRCLLLEIKMQVVNLHILGLHLLQGPHTGPFLLLGRQDIRLVSLRTI